MGRFRGRTPRWVCGVASRLGPLLAPPARVVVGTTDAPGAPTEVSDTVTPRD
ncbi:hypothetical protein BDK92_6701 [Micromonospora pisi]|uniref:Uncharacterized protein n=1 Tax=Micromonospora pisi TaxID=589240 RepID=A0A495JTE8_9ACTN|nr:hypothetical protein [Micromonospora pisi]RKR92263.1 hypothetical protein BDK92_6701 [Micromonospora pisi]